MLDSIGRWCVDSVILVNPTRAALACFSLNNNNIVYTSTPSVSMPAVSVERSINTHNEIPGGQV